jgi:SAM-dependent methyltransferase
MGLREDPRRRLSAELLDRETSVLPLPQLRLSLLDECPDEWPELVERRPGPLDMLLEREGKLRTFLELATEDDESPEDEATQVGVELRCAHCHRFPVRARSRLSCTRGQDKTVSEREAFAQDGSPVALYARLEPMGEAEVIHAAVPAGCEILELGAGAGRITHRLVELGHSVVAVDQSPEMLRLVQGAETVLGDIETLSLARRFPVVVLASNFINDADPARRHAYLACCARHVLPSGQVLLEGFPRDWTPSTDWFERGGVRGRLCQFEQNGPVVSGEMEYIVDGQTLTHLFESRLLTEDELAEDLRAAGLRLRRTLDERGSWIEAVPAKA